MEPSEAKRMSDHIEAASGTPLEESEAGLQSIPVLRLPNRPFLPADVTTVLRVGGAPALDVVLLVADSIVTGQAVEGAETDELLTRLRGIFVTPQLSESARIRLSFNAAGQLAFSILERLISGGAIKREGLESFVASLQKVLEEAEND